MSQDISNKFVTPKITQKTSSQSFSSLVSNQDKYLYKILGKDSVSKRDSWWILRVIPAKEVIFSKIIMKGNLNLSEYGEILDSGFGEKIPPEMLTKHGFNLED